MAMVPYGDPVGLGFRRGDSRPRIAAGPVAAVPPGRA
jgi:hypothetical protein